MCHSLGSHVAVTVNPEGTWLAFPFPPFPSHPLFSMGRSACEQLLTRVPLLVENPSGENRGLTFPLLITAGLCITSRRGSLWECELWCSHSLLMRCLFQDVFMIFVHFFLLKKKISGKHLRSLMHEYYVHMFSFKGI